MFNLSNVLYISTFYLIILFSSFILSMWCNYICILGMNPSWPWSLILLMYCQIHFTNILLKIFVSIFIRNIAYNSLFLYCPCLVWYQENSGSWNVWKASFLFNFLKSLKMICRVICRIQKWIHLILAFVCWEILGS